ncbi:hypothetical protein [Kitasatospora cineracea]|uniref:hypothetical protein n=1 Tax=Kitasatospora cineracea TaxID=88074 RepID=UPI0036A980EF
MAAHNPGSADDLPIPAHHRPEVDTFISSRSLCETRTEIAHGLVEHAITVAWARRAPAWSTLDLGHFHQVAQHFAYPELFRQAVSIGGIEHIEHLAAQVQAGLDANYLLTGYPTTPYGRWTAVLDANNEIVSVTIATGDSEDTNNDHLRNMRQHTGTIIDVDAPSLHAAFALLLDYREGGDRNRRAATPRGHERSASPHRRWTAILDADNQLMSIAIAAGGNEEDHFEHRWTHNEQDLDFVADDIDPFTAFARLLARIEDDDAGFIARFEAGQAERLAAHAAKTATREGR